MDRSFELLQVFEVGWRFVVRLAGRSARRPVVRGIPNHVA